jgi:hypothetical protein
VIYIGIDDTDTLETQGTNQLARMLVARLGVRAADAMIVRHQLFFDPRVPYTSHNGSASILLQSPAISSITQLIDELRHGVQSWFVHGSDPGLCVTTDVPDAVVEFGRRCQHELITQVEARDIAARFGIFLEGLGGTEQGVIGALAAVGLASSGNDGRVVHRADWPWPDELTGPQEIAALHARGVDEIRCVATHRLINRGIVDVGKRLRPNRRGSRIVLFVSPAPDSWPAPPFWHAMRYH